MTQDDDGETRPHDDSAVRPQDEPRSVAASDRLWIDRGGVVALEILLLLICLAWTAWTFLDYGFSGPAGRSSELQLALTYIGAGVIGLGLPLAVLVTYARRRRPGVSVPDAVVASIVVIVLALPAVVPAVVSAAPAGAADAARRTLPPTAAERQFEDGDVEAELRRVGDETVRLLGGDPEAVDPDDLVTTSDCELSNADDGVTWRYVFDPRYLQDLDGQPLLGEDETELATATGDLEAVRAAWADRGIGARDVPDAEWLVEAEAPWFEDGSAHAGVDGSVYLFTVCLVPPKSAP
jgi:hypothetical protein